MYQYTECGLDNVWLKNGYKESDSKWGPTVSIDDVDGLHRAIGLDIARRVSPLLPKEFKFLRVELGLAQRNLADMWKVTDQTIANYEKGNSEIPAPSQAILRWLYLESQNEESRVSEYMKALMRLDAAIAKIERKIKYRENTRGRWVSDMAAA